MVHMSAVTPETVSAANDLLEAMAVAVIVVDRNAEIRYANAAAEDLFATSRRHLVGASLWRSARLEPDWAGRLEAAIAGAEPFTAREVGITPVTGGSSCRVDARASPCQSDHWGDVLVLELSPVERHLRIAREEMLAAQEQANRSLLRGLAHEIRNPLGGLRGAAQLLEAELTEAGLREYTQVIVREADRLRDLVDRLMGPGRPPAMARVNIHELTEHVVSLLRAEAGAGVVITTDYDPSLPEAFGDRDQLIQALLNLGGNALQALAGSGHLTLCTSSRRRVTIGGMLHRIAACIEVMDDGPGVPPELADTLFQPMVSGRADGSGLGLTIAQSLIRRHGGLVECDSVPGATTFRVLLPLPEPGMESTDDA
jgi:two-component system nitrogen regulation sensor histidine kinase GlnL